MVPDKIKNQLKNIGLWELHPLNLFRISWKNEPVKKNKGLAMHKDFEVVGVVETKSYINSIAKGYSRRREDIIWLKRRNLKLADCWKDSLELRSKKDSKLRKSHKH